MVGHCQRCKLCERMIVTGPTHHVEKDTEMSGSGVGINHADMGQLRGLIDLAGRASCLAHFVYRRKELYQLL